MHTCAFTQGVAASALDLIACKICYESFYHSRRAGAVYAHRRRTGCCVHNRVRRSWCHLLEHVMRCLRSSRSPRKHTHRHTHSLLFGITSIWNWCFSVRLKEARRYGSVGHLFSLARRPPSSRRRMLISKRGRSPYISIPGHIKLSCSLSRLQDPLTVRSICSNPRCNRAGGGGGRQGEALPCVE